MEAYGAIYRKYRLTGAPQWEPLTLWGEGQTFSACLPFLARYTGRILKSVSFSESKSALKRLFIASKTSLNAPVHST